MEEDYEQNGPVVIGGVGGSGTRVVAAIVAAFGFYIGDDLNESVDNLWYTLLLKRRKWYYKNLTRDEAIYTGLSVLRKVMLNKGRLSVPECRFLIQAVVQMTFQGHNPLSGAGKGLWPFKRVWRMVKASKGKRCGYVGWGWKEPSSRLLIRHLANYFEHLKYIHTMRHGLDMAFSRNRQEIFLWGELYGVEAPRTPSEIPAAALRYWLRANRCALQAGTELGKDKFHVIDFDRFCRSPESELQSLVSFLQINPSREAVEKATTLIRQPGTIGRYRDHDLSQFDRDDLSALRTFGYDVE
jgi:hypothetical protein